MSTPDAGARIALVTGANRGIGRHTALHLAEDGIDVIIIYRSHPDEATAVVDELLALGRRATAIRLDVADVASFPRFADEVRQTLKESWDRDTFDHLVNN